MSSVDVALRRASGHQERIDRGKHAARFGTLAKARLAAFKLVAGIPGHS